MKQLALSLLWFPLLITVARAGCIEAGSDEKAFAHSKAVVKAEVVKRASQLGEDGVIVTTYVMRLREAYKGQVDKQFVVQSTGGRVGDRCDLRSDFLDLQEGETYALMMDEDGQGAWKASGLRAGQVHEGCGEMCRYYREGARGTKPATVRAGIRQGSDQGTNGVPGSKVTATGYSETSGVPTRWTTCDGDEAIPYVVDIDVTKLPTGMNQAGALAAVANALAAWENVSSLKFRFEGVQAFAGAASNMATNDGKLRIQLHDNFNAVGGGALGIGGGGFRTDVGLFTGGMIMSQGFQERLYGFVVMESTTNAPALQNAGKFTHVLTHEIGHALGLAHSSNDVNEPEPLLKNATMYYLSNTTGAVLNAYDVDRIQFGYPVSNTPPYAVDRVFSAVTAANVSQLPNVLGMNRFRVIGYDRQNTAMSPILSSASSNNGTFSLSGNELVFTPSGNINAQRLSDAQIVNGVFYDMARVQLSDGVNRSRVARFTVVGFHSDSTPSDGLPNDWMNNNFGTTVVGSVGSGRHPNDDPDGDGLTNRLEFHMNTNPNSRQSGPVTPVYDAVTRTLSFTPVRFVPYWAESSTTLQPGSFGMRRMAFQYQAGQNIIMDFDGNALPPQEFFRVVTGF